jgi:aconitate hydratase
VGMGVLPLQLLEGDSFEGLGLTGRERFDIPIGEDVKPGQTLTVTVRDEQGARRTIELLCRIDTPAEVGWYREGGILNEALRRKLG